MLLHGGYATLRRPLQETCVSSAGMSKSLCEPFPRHVCCYSEHLSSSAERSHVDDARGPERQRELQNALKDILYLVMCYA
mmetsp:Transcript_7252/g.30099  ORF Transcript_7252/g.30099 Transcript_7252/m.30099 type:complete len:80 (+) Transcript_7252:640-879(+)